MTGCKNHDHMRLDCPRGLARPRVPATGLSSWLGWLVPCTRALLPWAGLHLACCLSAGPLMPLRLGLPPGPPCWAVRGLGSQPACAWAGAPRRPALLSPLLRLALAAPPRRRLETRLAFRCKNKAQKQRHKNKERREKTSNEKSSLESRPNKAKLKPHVHLHKD